MSRAAVLGIWIAILALANDSPERGRLLVAAGVPVTAETIADETGIECNVIVTLLDRFSNMGMLYNDGNCLCITNWGTRQFDGDSSTERVRKHRTKNVAPDVTRCNGFSNVTVTPPDTDTETDTDSLGDSGVGGNSLRETLTSPTQTPSKPKTVKPQKPPPQPPHPAILAFRDAAGKYPQKPIWAAVIEAVGDEPGNLTFWGQVVTRYIGTGWNPGNVLGMIDWYKRRELPGVKHEPHQQHSSGGNSGKTREPGTFFGNCPMPEYTVSAPNRFQPGADGYIAPVPDPEAK